MLFLGNRKVSDFEQGLLWEFTMVILGISYIGYIDLLKGFKELG